MGRNHVFIVARNHNNRLLVPACVKKYGAKVLYGAENVFPTRVAYNGNNVFAMNAGVALAA